MYLRDRFPHPYSTGDALRFFDYAEHTREECVACIEVDGEAVGAIGILFRTDIERCSAELGYWLGEDFWGRGIITAAIRCFTDWAMPRFALTRVYAEVMARESRVGPRAGEGRLRARRPASQSRYQSRRAPRLHPVRLGALKRMY